MTERAAAPYSESFLRWWKPYWIHSPNISPGTDAKNSAWAAWQEALRSESATSYRQGLEAVQSYLRGAYMTSKKAADILDQLEAFIVNELNAAPQLHGEGLAQNTPSAAPIAESASCAELAGLASALHLSLAEPRKGMLFGKDDVAVSRALVERIYAVLTSSASSAVPCVADAPSSDELQWAREIVEAYDKHQGPYTIKCGTVAHALLRCFERSKP